MSRPPKECCIEHLPNIKHYKPAGVPLRELDEIVLSFEEMEAIRLADIELMDQASAAMKMDISRPTFNRIINRAHQKIAAALWQGKALRVEGGTFRINQNHNAMRNLICTSCGFKWDISYGTGPCHDLICPKCQKKTVSRN